MLKFRFLLTDFSKKVNWNFRAQIDFFDRSSIFIWFPKNSLNIRAQFQNFIFVIFNQFIVFACHDVLKLKSSDFINVFLLIIFHSFAAVNSPRFTACWSGIRVMNMRPNLLKRNDWKRLDEALLAKTSKRRFTSWRRWNTPISSIYTKSTKMDKMSS